MVAKTVHLNSNIQNYPFVSVNCGALPENLEGKKTGSSGENRGEYRVNEAMANGGEIARLQRNAYS